LKHKLKIVGRTLFCLILILSMVVPSLTSLAYTRPSTENVTTYATTVTGDAIKDYGNIIAVSLMEVDNSAKIKYQDAITAHFKTSHWMLLLLGVSQKQIQAN
jgi:hypothetical protein